MSQLKFSPDLFLETQELGRLKKFLDDDGFRQFFLLNSASFGLFKSEKENTFTNAKVTEGPGRTINHEEIKAVDKDGRIIYRPANQNIAVPSDGLWRWVRISFTTSNIEKGLWSLDANGNLTNPSGDGELTKIIRGRPNFSSVVRFLNSNNPTDKYEVLEVIDDNNAILSGSIFSAETSLQLVVVGTFTPGSIPSSGEEDIFVYDSCNFSLVLETVPNTAPTLTADYQFYIARVMKAADGSAITIEDKRNSIYRSLATFDLQTVFLGTSKVFGVERIVPNFFFGPKSENLVRVAWGLRSDTWSFNAQLNQITLSGFEGGRIKPADASLLANGDFNGWRVYTNTGRYFIVQASQIAGGQIILTLDQGDVVELTGAYTLVVVPNSEEIEIVCNSEPSHNTPNSNRRFCFPTAQAVADIALPVYRVATPFFNIRYRYKNFKRYSEYFTPLSDAIGFYNENQFTSAGVIVGSPTRTTYTSHPTNGFIPLILTNDAYYNFQSRVDVGDRYGADTLVLSNTTPVIDLYPGSNFQHLINDQGSFTLSTDIYINLKQVKIDNVTAIRNGNSFFIRIATDINLTSTPYTLKFVTDYINSSSFTLLKEITTKDTSFINESETGLCLLFTYNGSTWKVSQLSEADPYSEWTIYPYSALALDASAGTWTTASANNFKVKYKRIGKTVHLNFRIINTTINLTPASLRLKLPTGMTIKTGGGYQWNAYGFYGNTNDTPANGVLRIEANDGEDELFLSKAAGGNHATITGGLDVLGQITFEIN